MPVFIVLWPYLLTTKLRCLQKKNIGHTNLLLTIIHNFVEVIYKLPQKLCLPKFYRLFLLHIIEGSQKLFGSYIQTRNHNLISYSIVSCTIFPHKVSAEKNVYLIWKSQPIQIIATIFQFFSYEMNFWLRKLFKGGNYSRAKIQYSCL